MDNFNEVMIKAQQVAEALHNAIASVLDAWIQPVSETLDAIADVLEKIKSCPVYGNKPKWRIPHPQRIRPLLLDKRSKVHRCRNCC